MLYGRKWWTFVMTGSAAFTLFGVALVLADLNDGASLGRVQDAPDALLRVRRSLGVQATVSRSIDRRRVAAPTRGVPP